MKKNKINTVLQKLLDKNNDNNIKFIELSNGSYLNKLFGIQFNFPADWFVLNREQVVNSAENQLFVGEYEHHKEKFEINELPALLITKYNPSLDKYYGLISPTINFSIIPKHPDYLGLSLVEYADLIENARHFGYHPLKNFRVLNKGELEKIDNFNSIIYKTEYLFEHEELDFGIMVQMQVLNIDYEDFFLDFSMTDCLTQNQKESRNFENLIQSIKLNKHYG